MCLWFRKWVIFVKCDRLDMVYAKELNVLYLLKEDKRSSSSVGKNHPVVYVKWSVKWDVLYGWWLVGCEQLQQFVKAASDIANVEN